MNYDVEAVVTPTTSTVQVSSAVGGSGQAVTTTPSVSVELSNGVNSAPVEYKVGSGSWVTLDGGQGANLPINLAVTSLSLRKGAPVAASIPVTVTVNAFMQTLAGGTNLPMVVVGTAAPSNSDGRPDGTIYVQTA